MVRSAKIRVLNSENRNSIIIQRPIQHLIPLEIRAKTSNDMGNDASEESFNTKEQIEGQVNDSAKTSIGKEKSTKKKGRCSSRLLHKLSEQV